MTGSPLPILLRPSPFRLETRQHVAIEGQTIERILKDFPDLPLEVWTHGVVLIHDEVTGLEWEILREHWGRVKPRSGGRYVLRVGVRMGDSGDKGGGGKNPFATIAAIALLVVATAITGGAAAGLFGTTLFAAGSTSAALLAAGVSIVGALAINALAPPPTFDNGQAQEDQQKSATLGSASIQGNVLAPFDPIPFVIGRHRCSPPHLIIPWSESVNDDQYVNTIIGLNGAHDFEEILVNGTPIGDLTDVQYEIRDVVNDDSDITLIDKQVFEAQVGAELTGHKVQDDATSVLQNTANPSASYPKWASSRSRKNPEEIWINFLWTTLVMQDSAETVPAGVPVRLRIRRVGDVSWINLPEFHAQRERLDPFRGMIKLKFEVRPDTMVRLDQTPSLPPWKWAFYATNAQNSEAFATHAYFAPSTGNNAENVASVDGVAVVYLDPATFPAGTYDVQVMRGYGYKAQDLTASTYRLATQIPYFFTHTPATSPPSIRQEQAKTPSRMTWSSMASVWNEYPLGEKGLSIMAIRAKNIAISSISILASGYAVKWNGVSWGSSSFEPTRNPADWFRYLALGGQSVRAPYIAAQMDDDGLADWWDINDGAGGGPVYECNAYINSAQSVGQVLKVVAGCGRAVMRASDKVGVVVDNDRSGEGTIGTFTQRNTRGLTIRRAFPRIPDGFRVNYNDETNDFSTREIYVFRKPDGDNIESVTYTGITSEQQAVERAYHDLKQLTRRPALYSFETDIRHLYCVKGSMVRLIHDTIKRHYDSAAVAAVNLTGPDVTGLVLDSPLRLSLVGVAPMGVVIQLKDGTSITAQISEIVDTNTITFVTPFPDPGDILDEDCIVACGPFTSLGKRMLVLGVQPQNEFTASVTLVDEAPPDQWRGPTGEGWFAAGGEPWNSPL
jgi:hypothetical protein